MKTSVIETNTLGPRLSNVCRVLPERAIGAVLIAGGYGAWLTIPFVVASDLSSSIKAALTAFLGATPLVTKLLAIALLGRPTIEFLKKHSFKLLRKDADAAD